MSRYINPVPGYTYPPYGKLWFYKAGTNDELDTFIDELEEDANANPVLLDALGRAPNIWYTAKARVVLQDADGEQIWERDPVGGQTEVGDFQLFDSSVVYELNDIVKTSSGDFFKSLQNTNQNNTPATSAFWMQIKFIDVWNTANIFSVGDVCQSSDGNLWRSLTNSNTGNNPSSDDGTNWVIAVKQLSITTPTNTTPAASATDVDLKPTLISSAYSGTDDHINSQWQVASNADFSTLVYNSGAINDLVSHTLPANLSGSTVLYWRVRYIGVNTISAFSAGTSFTTTIALSGLFQTTIYDGTDGARSIVTGIDATARESLVWSKTRNTGSTSHLLYDTLRGALKYLKSNSTDGESTAANTLTSFNDNGFSLGTSSLINGSGDDYVAWQWAEQNGFLKIIQSTGTGVARSISYTLGGGEFGMIITKSYDTSSTAWDCTHKSLADGVRLRLNETSGTGGDVNTYPTKPTTTSIALGTNAGVNGSGDLYMHYVFAHNPTKGIFCGSYIGTGTFNSVEVGFPVGWILIKRTDGTDNWVILDVKRGATGTSGTALNPNTNTIESASSAFAINFGSTAINPTGADINTATETYIFMAIANTALF